MYLMRCKSCSVLSGLCAVCVFICCRSLAELGFRHGINYIIPVWTLLAPLRTKEVAVLLPPNVPCRCASLGSCVRKKKQRNGDSTGFSNHDECYL
jgi:hypothetical protein